MKIDQYVNTADSVQEVDNLVPRFDLGPDELSQIEAEIAENAREQFGDTMSVAWISPNHPHSNFIRTHEAKKFPEVAEADPEYDKNQLYLAIVDTRGGEGRVVHAVSIMSPRLIPSEDPEKVKTGLYTIDSLIDLGNFTANEFTDYYENQGVDISKSIAAETNFKIYDDVDLFNGLGTADLAYLALFNALVENDAPVGNTVLFATINSKQIGSLQRVGVDVELLMGRDDFHTEEADLGKQSMPVAILFNQNMSDIFTAIELELPELVYG